MTRRNSYKHKTSTKVIVMALQVKMKVNASSSSLSASVYTVNRIHTLPTVFRWTSGKQWQRVNRQTKCLFALCSKLLGKSFIMNTSSKSYLKSCSDYICVVTSCLKNRRTGQAFNNKIPVLLHNPVIPMLETSFILLIKIKKKNFSPEKHVSI